MQWLLRSTHLCFRCSFDDVTRINFRFRLLVTWLSVHGRDASSCKIWCIYLYLMRSYWHLAEIKDGGRRHLGFVGGSHGTTHEGTLVVCTSCKNFVVIGSVVFKLYGFEIFVVQAWKSYSRPKNFSFWGFIPPKFLGTLFKPSKCTSLRDFTSFELSCVKIHPRVWPVGWSKKKGINKNIFCYISPICPEAPSGWISTKFGTGGPLADIIIIIIIIHRLITSAMSEYMTESDIINCAEYFVDRFRGIDFVGGWNLPISIGIEGRR